MTYEDNESLDLFIAILNYDKKLIKEIYNDNVLSEHIELAIQIINELREYRK